jgi:hypothetical protein
VNIKKPALGMKEPTVEQPTNTDTKRPKNPSASTIPSEGYVLEIDGKLKSEFETSEAAMKSALELKKRYPQIQVNVYDAKERARTLVELTDKSGAPAVA